MREVSRCNESYSCRNLNEKYLPLGDWPLHDDSRDGFKER